MVEFKWIIIIIIGLVAYSMIKPQATDPFATGGRWIKDTATGLLGKINLGSGTTTTPAQQYGQANGGVSDGNRSILGPVYTEVPCKQDIECQEWYKCVDCYCDSGIGKCWYG